MERSAQIASHSAMLSACLKALAVDLRQLERVLHGGRGMGEDLVHKVKKSDELCQTLGLTYQKLPSKVGEDARLFYQNVKFLEHAVNDRDPDTIAKALPRTGLLDAVLSCADAQPSASRRPLGEQ